jgi:predicted ribosome quality control (RQC) complex YloA/Tae2 family protein
MHPRIPRARKNSVDILQGAHGLQVEEIFIDDSDRVITLQLTTPLRIVLSLFGPRSNAVLAGADNLIRDAFLRPKEVAGTPLGAPKPGPPALFHAAEIVEELEGTLLPADALRRIRPQLGRELAAEIVYRSGIDPGMPCTLHNEDTRRNLLHALQEVLDALEHPEPGLYIGDDGSPLLFTPIRLRSFRQGTYEAFGSIDEALRSFFARSEGAHALAAARASLAQRFSQIRDHGTRTLAAMDRDARDQDRTTRYQEFGETLMQFLLLVPKGVTSFLPPGSPGPAVPLDPMLTPVQNAQRYFEKAKRARQARERTGTRRIRVERQIRLAEDLLGELSTLRTAEGIRNFMKQHAEQFDRLGAGEKDAARKQIPFRIFTVDGGYEVWAGRNNTNNDLLTLKYARQNDLWFHARGSPGSHVVLRIPPGADPPGKKARQQAAAIAAYYSKMRGAKTVPVAVTLKKFVHKPRGAPPGTVSLSREDVIFAEPGLPQGQAGDPYNEKEFT